MNKKELIQETALRSGLSQADAEKALNCIIETIGNALKKEESITLVGFGTFSVKERAARQGHNPRTGLKIAIPAKKVVKFQPGKGLEIDPK